jgi:two-component system copper resistance phosphate regulon response regulator CusR
MRILLVEDENRTAAYLRKGLMENGFAVDVTRQNGNVTELAGQAGYDLLVLDGVSERLRLSGFGREGQTTPVLFLTAHDDVGWEPWANNCLRKPFAFSDFLFRIRSMLRWGPARVMGTLHIADLEMDLVRHRATRSSQRLDLTPKEFLLLSLLMRKTGEVLSRAVISDQVWEINFDRNTNFVDVHIRRLRAKVDDPYVTKLIHTVRGSGYVLEERA